MIRVNNIDNPEAESNILGLLLIDSTNIPKVKNELKVTDFFDKKNQYIYEAILSLAKEAKPVDIVSVSELLKFNNQLELIGGRSYINDLALKADGDITQLLKILIKYSKKRQLISICNDSLLSLENSTDVDDVALTLSKTSQDIINRTSTTQLQSIMDGVVEALNEFEQMAESEQGLLGVDTGFNELNMLLSGLCPGRFYILAARPSVGKSAIAQQIAEHVAQNKVVLYISLEMSTSEYTQRSIYRRSGYNQDSITRRIIPQIQIFEAFNIATAELNNLKLYIVDDSKCTLATIERNIQECKVKFGGCDLVVIDYIQLMKSNDKYKNKDYDIVTDNSKGLKQLARKYKLPILALAQLSREVEKRADKKPILSDLRDSGSLEQDADVVMFLHRPNIDFPDNISLRNKAYLILAKNRQGKRGVSIPMVFNDMRVQFTESINNGSNL